MVLYCTAALLAAAAWGLTRLLRIAAVGAGYKAKVLGSAVFVSGRSPEAVLREDVAADKYRILRLFRADVDRQRGEVTASLLGLCGRRAVFRPGLGVTLTKAARVLRLCVRGRKDGPANRGRWHPWSPVP